MLRQEQDFADSWRLPVGGVGRDLFERPLLWEFFYDAADQALVRLQRIIGSMRRAHRALGSRGFFFYYADPTHLDQGIVAYRRWSAADGTSAAQDLLILLNFSDRDALAWIPFPTPGRWVEQVDGMLDAIDIAHEQRWSTVRVPSNHGAVYKCT
jgi:maltooligosyltrehalose trehalohydrolase